jgi:DNA-binding transcriptional regulator WhiA
MKLSKSAVNHRLRRLQELAGANGEKKSAPPALRATSL